MRGWVAVVVRGGSWRFSDPEGAVQDILLKLLRLVSAGKVREPGGFLKMVRTVAKYTCVDLYHADRTRASRETSATADEDEAPFDPPSDDDGPDEGYDRRERYEFLLYVYQRLPAACRELWDLVYREGKSAAEVGERLGIRAGNVRVRVHRCLETARGLARGFEGAPT